MNAKKMIPPFSLTCFDQLRNAVDHRTYDSVRLAVDSYLKGVQCMIEDVYGNTVNNPVKWLREEETLYFLSFIKVATCMLLEYRKLVINDWAKFYGENKKGGAK